MKSKLLMAVAAVLFSTAASADVVCNSCDYINGQPGTYLGDHNPNTQDNSTFSNATTGTNGNFSNWWVFDINPGGAASVNAIFLPINNISNFDVKLYSMNTLGTPCAANTGSTGGACSNLTQGGLEADGFTSPAYATVIDFTQLAAGRYAFNVTGTISGLGPNQPASYTGNLQVNNVPEPASLALMGAALLGMGAATRKGKQSNKSNMAAA